MAFVPSLARRLRAHLARIKEVWLRITADGVITPKERTEFGELLDGAEAFGIALDSAHQVTQATARATDNERLEDVWATHMMALAQLPVTV